MTKPREIVTIDCETDPFKKGRVPEPFIWGSFDGQEFRTFETGRELVDFWREKHVYLFAHNGGKFDFLFLLPYFEETNVLLINGRIVSCKLGKAILRDSLSIIPLAQKQFDKSEFDYGKLEKSVRHKYQDEIREYLKSDVVKLHGMITRYFEIVGNKSTIASNALSFARSIGVDPGKTNHRFDNVFRPFYYGGRVEAFAPGSHGRTHLLDIASAYPYAMEHYLPSGNIFISTDNIDVFDEAEINKAFIYLRCFSNKAFPVIRNHTLNFPAEYGEFMVSGWEYNVAKKHGLISDVEIIEAHIFEDEITFKPYTDHWFALKAKAKAEDNKADYIIAKIMLNSLYGKLAQDPTKYSKYKIVEEGTRPDIENGWILDEELPGGKELHSKSMLAELEEKDGDEWQWKDIHFNVATAASITGFTRAMILDAAATVGFENVLYCDTDCLFIKDGANYSGLRLNDGLGSWENEGTASEVHIAGKKLYAAKLEGKKAKTKTASKGARLTFSEIKAVAHGETVTWENEAPTLSFRKNHYNVDREKLFMVRRVTATVQLPNR